MRLKIAQLLFLLLAPSISLVSQTISPDPPLVFPQQFVHPGLLQSKADLDFMKAKIKSGNQDWVAAYKKLQDEATMDFEPQAFTHVIRGSYGRQGQGLRELSASALDTDRLCCGTLPIIRNMRKKPFPLLLPGRENYGILMTMMPS